MAEGQPTDHPILARLFAAQKINQEHGGAVIAAWEVDDLPQSWLDALTGYRRIESEMRESLAEFKVRGDAWRDSHPTYKKEPKVRRG